MGDLIRKVLISFRLSKGRTGLMISKRKFNSLKIIKKIKFSKLKKKKHKHLNNKALLLELRIL